MAVTKVMSASRNETPRRRFREGFSSRKTLLAGRGMAESYPRLRAPDLISDGSVRSVCLGQASTAAGPHETVLPARVVARRREPDPLAVGAEFGAIVEANIRSHLRLRCEEVELLSDR